LGAFRTGAAGAPGDEAEQEFAQAQSVNAVAEPSGADGVPITAPDWSISCTSSPGLRFAGAPLRVAPLNRVSVSCGREVSPTPFAPKPIGVSSIHSAVDWVDEYGTVVEKLSPLLVSLRVIVQSSELGTTSPIDAWM
jgi:hypothetical protein